MSQPDPKSSPSSVPPLDSSAPQLTVRAVATGMLLGGILSLTNIYMGLKIGWGFNMSVTAMLVSFGLYRGAEQLGARRWGMLENNINQTGASAAASISSAGLVAAIPALSIIEGRALSYPVLVVWTLTVSLVGVMVAIGLREQMLVRDRLPFPYGVASAETIKQMYAQGREAMARVIALGVSALGGALVKTVAYLGKLHAVGLPGSLSASSASGVGRYTLANLGFSLDPSVLMIGAGMIIGIRAGASMLVGVVVAWGVLAPMAVDSGWVVIPDALQLPDKLWFGPINKWMLWPGVALMVTSALTSFAFSWRSVLEAVRAAGSSAASSSADGDGATGSTDSVPRRWFLGGLAVVGVAAAIGQIVFFDVTWWIAILAVLLTFFLAIVAGRVSGETGITPVGPMGKVTQLIFGVLSPQNVAGNLMAANVTGGAASQCGDMLHDLKAGALIGASPRQQAIAQAFGVLAGCAGYMVLVPDPASMLLTDEWPAPAVAAWKGVAELFRDGIDGLPPMAVEAMFIGGGLGIVLAILEKVLPKKWRVWVPSPAAVGIAIVIPAYYAISMFVGGVIGKVLHWRDDAWAKRFVIVIGAGLIAGESVVGVIIAIYKTLAGVSGG